MRLVRLSVANFRSISDKIVIELPSQHVALVGANNAGKSNILSALDWVLGSRAPYQLRAEDDDYFDRAAPIVIEAVIGEVTTADRKSLMAIATNQKQRGALSSNKDPQVELSLTLPPLEGTAEEPDDEEDESSTAVSRPTLAVKLWGFGVYRKQTEIRRGLVQLIRVGPERRVTDDLQASRWTPYGQLMKTVLEASPDYQDLVTLLQQVNAKIQGIFASEKVSLLADARVVSYVDDIAFQLTRENKPTELLRYLEILITEGGRQVNLSRVGTGTQSAVIIGMLELALRARTSDSKVFAVEEPDSFIHPHGVRRLAELIREIGDDHGAQVVLTTHSAALLAGLSPGDIVRVEKEGGKTAVYQSPGKLSDPAFARFIDSESAEMFFAQRVVLVEGDTERFLLPPLASMLTDGTNSLDFDRRRMSLVSMDTKDNIVNYLRILDEFKIDAVAVLDHDFLAGSSCRSLVTHLRARGVTIDDSNESQLVKGLLSCGIIVLSKGEIEDYIPDTDIAAATGETLAAVQAEIAATPKTSNAFRKLFHSGKPVYGRRLAEYYVNKQAVPDQLDRIIHRLCA